MAILSLRVVIRWKKVEFVLEVEFVLVRILTISVFNPQNTFHKKQVDEHYCFIYFRFVFFNSNKYFSALRVLF